MWGIDSNYTKTNGVTAASGSLQRQASVLEHLERLACWRKQKQRSANRSNTNTMTMIGVTFAQYAR